MRPPSERFREINEHDHPALALVGRIASSWAILEGAMDVTIWWLADVKEEEGACITAQLVSIHSRLRAIIALARLKSCPKIVIDRLNKFSSDSERIVRLRNRAIHDPWYRGLETGQLAQHKLTAEKELIMEMTPRSIADLERTLSEIQQLRSRFTRLMEELDYPTSLD
jgi:hypothetical protein